AGNQTTMSILVNDADVEQAVADLLGSQEMDPNVHGQLNRVIPMTHPRFHWMFAERITGAHPIRFTDKRQGFGTSKYAAYAARVLTVLFTQPKYSIFSDAQLDLRYGAPARNGGGSSNSSTNRPAFCYPVRLAVSPLPKGAAAPPPRRTRPWCPAIRRSFCRSWISRPSGTRCPRRASSTMAARVGRRGCCPPSTR